jgi:hypothetical protein
VASGLHVAVSGCRGRKSTSCWLPCEHRKFEMLLSAIRRPKPKNGFDTVHLSAKSPSQTQEAVCILVSCEAKLRACLARRFKNSSGSSDGVTFLIELEPFWKTFGKTASPVGLRL